MPENNLKPFDSRYKDNEYYKQNYISRLQEIINQDSMKTRSGTKTITPENKDKAKKWRNPPHFSRHEPFIFHLPAVCLRYKTDY